MRWHGAGALALLCVAVAANVATVGAQPVTGRGKVTFVAQTPWVGAGGDFLLPVKVDRPTGASNLEFGLTVFPAVSTRSALG